MFLKELTDFSLQSLKVFIYVASLGSVAQAAKAMGLTQPAISLQIHNLEKHLEFHLFESQGRKNVLTAKGESFLQKLLPQLERLEQVLAESRDLDSLSRPKLEVGAVEGIGEFWLASRFLEYAEVEGEATRFFLEIEDNDVLEEHLLTGRLSLIISTKKLEHPQVLSRVLMEEKLMPVGTAESIAKLRSLLDKAEKTKRVWQDVDWVGYGHTLETDQWVTRWLENIGFFVDRKISYKHKMNSFSVIKKLLQEGRGICVAPAHTCDNELKDQSLVALETKKYPSLKNTLYISSREASLNKVHQAFFDWLLKSAKKTRY